MTDATVLKLAKRLNGIFWREYHELTCTDEYLWDTNSGNATRAILAVATLVAPALEPIKASPTKNGCVWVVDDDDWQSHVAAIRKVVEEGRRYDD